MLQSLLLTENCDLPVSSPLFSFIFFQSQFTNSHNSIIIKKQPWKQWGKIMIYGGIIVQFNHERQIFPWLLGIFLFILPDSREKCPALWDFCTNSCAIWLKCAKY